MKYTEGLSYGQIGFDPKLVQSTCLNSRSMGYPIHYQTVPAVLHDVPLVALVATVAQPGSDLGEGTTIEHCTEV
jgi:hypothetical protein